jgi:hypothetical protein
MAIRRGKEFDWAGRKEACKARAGAETLTACHTSVSEPNPDADKDCKVSHLDRKFLDPQLSA